MEKFDPLRSKADFKELERMSLDIFRRGHEAATGMRDAFRDLTIAARSESKDKRTIAISGELSPDAAMSYPYFAKAAEMMAQRAAVVRMARFLSRFSAAGCMESGCDGFASFWNRCYRNFCDTCDDGLSEWMRMEKKAFPDGNLPEIRFIACMKVEIDAARPEDSQFGVRMEYRIDCPFVMPQEREGKIVPFPEWLECFLKTVKQLE